VPRPKGKSILSSKWIYKIKHVTNGSVEKYKAKFVASGFSQKEGEDYENTYSPIPCMHLLDLLFLLHLL